MKQGKFGRIVLVVSALATLGLVALGVDGYRLGDAPEELRAHLGLAMAVTLALLFGHLWVALYLLALVRTLRARGEELLAGEAWSRRRRRSLAGAVGGALVLLLAVFLLGPAAMLGMLPAWVHGAAFFAALAAQVGSLLVEARALRDAERSLAALYARLG